MTAFPASQIPVYYINVASRLDRRQFMEEQFARLGIVAERLDAVTPREVSDTRMAAHQGSGTPSAMARVEVACSMSHEKAWRLFLSRGQPVALVLEDDVVMGNGLKTLLSPSVYADIDAELVKLETTYELIRVGQIRRTAGHYAIRQLLATHVGTGAYVITADMARRVLADPRLQAITVDNYLFSRKGPVIPSRGLLQVEPAPAVQLVHYRGGKRGQAGDSDLEGDRAHLRAARPRRDGWRSALASISYTLRLVAHILPDPEARRQKRRAIAFEHDA
ncbi:hypothetical protein VW23_027755 [Devosia insulae DS-56]|uniref:Glycosyl transferase family 25 domain-containing protein n=1 Tax=Devosia insulae DS-56 TaxID=1116389 RepID=A0A1E5XK08_9HYPH|nr:glycosyltransferase family 25 protein [Devosia insulae]OEO28933.1 hypothetical protein VW23_027755 [Devosia insulae DS-56]